MRILAILLGVAGAALLAAVFMLASEGRLEGDPLSLLGQLFLDADPIAKLMMMLVIAAAVITTIVGASGLVRPAGAPSAALTTLSWVCPLMGLLAGAYVAANTYSAVQRLHVTRLAVYAPSLAEGALAAAAGALVGALAAGLNAARTRS
jgi:hypothetical protein